MNLGNTKSQFANRTKYRKDKRQAIAEGEEERLLQEQEEILQQIIPHVSHIHARVGHEQGPQVNNPAAPEWKLHVDQFIIWWQKIISIKKE